VRARSRRDFFPTQSHGKGSHWSADEQLALLRKERTMSTAPADVAVRKSLRDTGMRPASRMVADGPSNRPATR